jgi:hypothetical protein
MKGFVLGRDVQTARGFPLTMRVASRVDAMQGIWR